MFIKITIALADQMGGGVVAPTPFKFNFKKFKNIKKI